MREGDGDDQNVSDSAVSISGTFTYGTSAGGGSRPPQVTFVPPAWLMTPALSVLADLQASTPIAGLQITASPLDGINGLHLGIVESSERLGELVELADDLDPDAVTNDGGGNWVPRSLDGPGLLVLIADLLQEVLAETSVGWGQSRPPCPRHPHPARPTQRDGDAWWVCPGRQTALYRIGRGEVPRGT